MPFPPQAGSYTIALVGAPAGVEAPAVPSVQMPGASGDAGRRAAERACEPGHYCVGGVRRVCPAGRYGADLVVYVHSDGTQWVYQVGTYVGRDDVLHKVRVS